MREPRYSWAYMLQRPAANNASVANLTVVVYNGRPLGSASIETALGGPQAAAAAGQKFITFSGTPSITRGSWLLDANVSTEKQPDPHGFFYRVVDISNPTATTTQVELQTPLRVAINTTGQVILMNDVVEVFDRGTGWRPD